MFIANLGANTVTSIRQRIDSSGDYLFNPPIQFEVTTS